MASWTQEIPFQGEESWQITYKVNVWIHSEICREAAAAPWNLIFPKYNNKASNFKSSLIQVILSWTEGALQGHLNPIPALTLECTGKLQLHPEM